MFFEFFTTLKAQDPDVVQADHILSQHQNNTMSVSDCADGSENACAKA